MTRYVPAAFLIVVLATGCDGSGSRATSGTASSQQPTGTSSGPTAARAKTWPAAWCQAKPGMTRAEMTALMGPPTGEVTQNDVDGGDPQMSWDYAEYQFNAFFDVNDEVRQLDVNDLRLSAAEKSAITCETTRTAP